MRNNYPSQEVLLNCSSTIRFKTSVSSAILISGIANDVVLLQYGLVLCSQRTHTSGVLLKMAPSNPPYDCHLPFYRCGSVIYSVLFVIHLE